MKKKRIKAKKRSRFIQKLMKLFKLSFVRFEEPIPHHLHREDDEEFSHWYRMF